jgi:pimeloyl-ACP methyl ester carboxylesterase
MEYIGKPFQIPKLPQTPSDRRQLEFPSANGGWLATPGPPLSDPGLLDCLGRVRVPALRFWGPDDIVVTADFGSAYTAARFVAIPGAGQIPTYDDLAATLRAIDDFLATPAT